MGLVTMVRATLSAAIEADLWGRLSRGEVAVRDLTLQALAGRYGVSLTPVRRAVERLIARGVLVRGATGRLAVGPGSRRRRPPPGSPPQPRPALELEARLTELLVRKSLAGDAGFLREQATARQLGVGRTALRQALARLAGRGLVEHARGRGWHPRPFHLADLEAYLEIREALELKALELAWSRLDPHDLRQMLRGNATNAQRLDNQIHQYLIEKSANRYLIDFFERHAGYFSSLLDFAAPAAHVLEQMARQHRAILRALLKGDQRRARLALAVHIRAQAPIVRKLLAAGGQAAQAGSLPAQRPDRLIPAPGP